MRNPARFPLKEGLHSRQAHADLPEQAVYEREVGREGFFGPASHIHHKHPPTGWVEWEGELRELEKMGNEKDKLSDLWKMAIFKTPVANSQHKSACRSLKGPRMSQDLLQSYYQLDTC